VITDSDQAHNKKELDHLIPLRSESAPPSRPISHSRHEPTERARHAFPLFFLIES